MNNYGTFLTEQAKIYAKIRRAGQKAMHRGWLKRDPRIDQFRTGSVITFQHAPAIASTAASISQAIAELVPAVRHCKKDIHTTICTPPEQCDIVDELWNAVRPIWTKTGAIPKDECTITFGVPIHNQHSVVVPGFLSAAGYDLAAAIIEACQRVCSDCQPCWGSHITLNRFTTDVAINAESPLMLTLDSLPPLGISRIHGLVLARYQMSDERFCLTTVHNFAR